MGKYYLEGGVHMLVFCLLLSIVTNQNVSVCTERENNCARLGYFRVPGAELCEVYEIATYRVARKIIY